MNPSTSKHSEKIKSIAKDLGFDFCGISKAEFLEEDAENLDSWLKKGMHGEMNYMENHFDKRLDPTQLVPGTKSVISLLYNYYPPEKQNPDSYQISKYAYGKDYHKIIKKILKDFMAQINQEIGQVEGRFFVDSAPVMERSWAKKSGLGWIGKNSLLINKQHGSFYFIAELLLDIALAPDGPIKDYCGTCTRCIDACPTDAIVGNQIVDGSKCISYFTIELKKETLPFEITKEFKDWMFGCDICQDVCPWNRFSKPHHQTLFAPHEKLLSLNKEDWKQLEQETFNEIFQQSAVKRAKFEGLKRNIKALSRHENS